jgi:hypothetical protein
MYLDAEISDHLHMALLLKTKTEKHKKQQTKNYYMLGLCVSLDRVLTRHAPWFLLASWVGYCCFICVSKPRMVLSVG